MSEVTQILQQIEDGDTAGADKLLPLVYEELRKLASVRLSREKPGQTLQPTALVHEAYMRVVRNPDAATWTSRAHFFGAAAEAMRRILIDQARRKRRLKHGGNLVRQDLAAVEPENEEQGFGLIELDEALTRLAETDPRAAKVVRLRFFAGLTIPQVAEVLDVSSTTVENDWAYARSWLRLEVSGK